MIIDDIKLYNTDNSQKVDKSMLPRIYPIIFPYFDAQYEKITEFADKLDSLNVSHDIKDLFFLSIEEAYKLGKIDQERYRDYLDSKNC